jgi:hypothetical protein
MVAPIHILETLADTLTALSRGVTYSEVMWTRKPRE